MTAEDDLREGKAIRQTLPELIIHAGTHKTASTYIQERLHRNKTLLLQWGIDVQDPQLNRPKPKRLVSALCNQRWNEWNNFLKHKNHQHNLLLSAEQFSVPFTNPECISKFQSIAKSNGYRPHIVIFIRSQLDYINSRYIYSLRRFYHDQSFEKFVNDALCGRLFNEKRTRGSITRRQDVFDFWTFFQPLLNAKANGFKVTFIPFKHHNTDPFDQIIKAIGLSPDLTWTSCENSYSNKSPGIRGVWMARLLAHLIKTQSIPVDSIRNSSQIILKEERRRRWNDPRFWGFSRDLSQRVVAQYAEHNDHFAQAVWGCSWTSVFNNDAELLQRQRSVYLPASISEELRMHAIGSHLLRRIEHQRHTKPWHVLTEPLASAIDLVLPTLSDQCLRGWESRTSVHANRRTPKQPIPPADG